MLKSLQGASLPWPLLEVTQPTPFFSPPETGDCRPPVSGHSDWAGSLPPSLPSTDLTSQLTLDDDDIEMETTAPCYATTIISSPGCDGRFMPVSQIQYSMEHRCPTIDTEKAMDTTPPP